MAMLPRYSTAHGNDADLEDDDEEELDELDGDDDEDSMFNEEDEAMEDGQYTKKVLGLAARAVAVHCLNSRMMHKSELPWSCFCFSETNPVRRLCRTVVFDRRFESVTLALIVANAITLALDAPNWQDQEGLIDFLHAAEIFFVCAFTVEAALKIVAMGFVGHSQAYLSVPWNWLDFAIVIVALLDQVLTFATDVEATNVSAFRLLRVLRPLRTVSQVKGMRAIISTLAFSLPLLGNVFLLLLLLLVLFAIVGVQLWSTSYHRRCFDSFTNELIFNETDGCSTLPTGRSCTAPNSTCGHDNEQFHVDFLNYDHIGYALIVVFKVVSLDDWPHDMKRVQETYMHICWVYFFILVLLGAYFAVNLFLAVLSSFFTCHEQLEAQEQEKMENEVRLQAVVAIMKQGTERAVQTKMIEDGAEVTVRDGTSRADLNKADESCASEGSMMLASSASSCSSFATKRSRTGFLPRQTLVQGKAAPALPPLKPPLFKQNDWLPYSVVLRNESALLLHSGGMNLTGFARMPTDSHYEKSIRRHDDYATLCSPMSCKAPKHLVSFSEPSIGSDDMEAESTESGARWGPEVGPLMQRHGCLFGLRQNLLLADQSTEIRSDLSGSTTGTCTDTPEPGAIHPNGKVPILRMSFKAGLQPPAKESFLASALECFGSDCSRTTSAANLKDLAAPHEGGGGGGELGRNGAEKPAHGPAGARPRALSVASHGTAGPAAAAADAAAPYGLDSEADGGDDSFDRLPADDDHLGISFINETPRPPLAPAHPKPGSSSNLSTLFSDDEFELVYHWDVKYDVTSFSEDSSVYHCECKEYAGGVDSCKTVCIEQDYSAFAVVDGIAYFTTRAPGKLRQKLRQQPGTIIFLLSTWRVFNDFDAFHGHDVETLPLTDLSVSRRYCLDKGYGGFAVKGSVVYYRKQRATECAELLCRRVGLVFHLPNAPSIRLASWRKTIRRVVLDSRFEQLMLAITIVNVVALATDHHGMRSDVVLAIEIINTACTGAFMSEILMKIVGLGPRLTFRDHYNTVDALLVAVGIPQSILYWTNVFGDGGAVSVFRLLRAGRILRLGRRWNLLRRTIQIVAGSISSVANLSMLVGLVVFMYSVMGMHLFGYEDWDGDRLDFSTLFSSFLTVFVIITGEGWSRVMEQAMYGTGWGASVYFISLFVIGRYIILNLFIAIIMDNFHKEREAMLLSNLNRTTAQAAVVEDDSPALLQQRISSGDEDNVGDNNVHNALPVAPGGEGFTQADSSVLAGNGNGVARDSAGEEAKPHEATVMFAEQLISPINENPPGEVPGSPLSLGSPASGYTETRRLNPLTGDASARAKSICELRFVDDRDGEYSGRGGGSRRRRRNTIPPLHFGERTCYLFRADGALRRRLTPIVTSTVFDYSMTVVIVLNLLFLAADNPATREDATIREVFFASEVTVAVVFLLEMLAKIIVFGVLHTSYAYLKDLWNVIDALVAMTAVLGLFLRFFQLFRSVRVFRLAIRSLNVKVVLYAAVGAMPSVMNGLVICGFAFILFGILGVQLFQGILVQCTDESVSNRGNCTGDYFDAGGMLRPREWITLDYNYNNIGESLFTLLKVALGEDWVTIMFATVDATGEDTGPRKDHNVFVVLFYVVFIVIAAFLCLNLIISILISSFSSYHEARFVHSLEDADEEMYESWKSDLRRFNVVHHQFLTDGQKRWVRSQQLLVSDVTYIPLPEARLRRCVYTFVESREFEWAIGLVIFMNLLLLCTQHADESEAYARAFSILNYVFVAIFLVEAALKAVGYGVRGYFLDSWNRFDFVILLVSILGLILGETLTVFRVLRIARVLRLFHMSKGLSKMFSALLYALPPLFNIGLLVLCVFFVFGVMGVDMFGRLDLDRNPYLNDYLNFQNLPEAALLLFQIATGELWIAVMQGCRVSPPDCLVPECGTDWAVLYFLLFMLLVSFLMVNLFVAVVLEAFQDADDVLSNDELVHAFREFRREWLSRTFRSGHDNNTMKVDDVIQLLQSTPPPLGLSLENRKRDTIMLKLLKNLNIPVDANMMVQYTDAVHALARNVFEINIDKAFELSHLSPVRLSSDTFTLAHVWCVRKILNTWKKHVNHERVRREHNEAVEASIDNGEEHGVETYESRDATAVFTPFTSVAVRAPVAREPTLAASCNTLQAHADHATAASRRGSGSTDSEDECVSASQRSKVFKRRKSIIPWDRFAHQTKPYPSSAQGLVPFTPRRTSRPGMNTPGR
ncbi:Voltage-dependent calcium channel type A subunit alpha-1 [Diplonema papillatum]|nr:Voltage-dependent calcium channel type A subunit alpha-1 [Diplonema papillatum]